MDSAPITYAGTWTSEKPKGYLMSEKLDGVRAWWNGYDFISRDENVFAVPDWFKAGMPQGVQFDGELFDGRDGHNRVQSQLKGGGAWTLTYCIFDLPQHGGTVEERVAHLAKVAPTLPPWASVVEHTVCQGMKHLKAEMRRLWAIGGEGVMLRAAGSRYTPGRNNTWLKVRCVNNTDLMR